MARAIALFAILVGTFIGALATARLAAVVAATPMAMWLVEFPRLIDPTRPVSPSTAKQASSLAWIIADPLLLPAQFATCVPTSVGALPSVNLDHCLSVVNAALAANPASGEVWLHKAVMFANLGTFGPAWSALRNACRTAPREGWIATERVIFGLRLYPALSDDLKLCIDRDLQLVLTWPLLAEPLARAYATDPLLRASAALPLRALPPEDISRFVNLVRHFGRET